MEKMTLPPSDVTATPTFRQQISNLPPYVLTAWRSRHAGEGVELEARAIVDREAAAVRATGQEVDALAVWMRLADAAGRMREIPPALCSAATLAGFAAGIRTQGYSNALSSTPAGPR